MSHDPAVRSRSPVRFLRRCGVLPTPDAPRPRLDVNALTARRMPLAPPDPPAHAAGVAEGVPPPDRAGFSPWPPGRGEADG